MDDASISPADDKAVPSSSCTNSPSVDRASARVSRNLPSRTKLRACLPPADIHSIDNSLRLLIRHPKNRTALTFDDPQLSGIASVEKTVKNLIDWITSNAKLRLSNRAPFLLTPLLMKLTVDGIAPENDAKFVYSAVVYRLLCDTLAESPDDVPSLFTEWMCHFPEVSSFLFDRTVENVESAIKEQLGRIPRFVRSETLFLKCMAISRRLNDFAWDNEDETVFKEDTCNGVAKSARQYACELIVQSVSLEKDRDVIRMLSRICRISENTTSMPVEQHFRKTLNLLKSQVADSIADIEDGIRTTARFICTESNPSCGDCPLRSICNAYKQYVTEAAFMPLFVRVPQYQIFSLEKTCQNGKECLLCSISPDCRTMSVSRTTSGVVVYPNNNPRQRLHRGVCIVEDSESQSYFFPFDTAEGFENNRDKFRLMRVSLPTDMAASCEESLTIVRQSVDALALPSGDIVVQRIPQCDYATAGADGDVLISYFYQIRIAKSTCTNSRCGTWINGGDICREHFQVDCWKDFTHYGYCRHAVTTDRKEKLNRKKMADVPDSARLRALYESAIKRLGTVRYPD